MKIVSPTDEQQEHARAEVERLRRQRMGIHSGELCGVLVLTDEDFAALDKELAGKRLKVPETT